MSTHSDMAALRGEPSYVWRAGQERRMTMIRQAAGKRLHGRILEDGCGVGSYLIRLAKDAALAAGLEVEWERCREAQQLGGDVLCGVGEALPYPANIFDLVLSHEVLEHVVDDRQSTQEIVRVLRPGGRLVLFVPNRGYPFETHGIYWKGSYHFGNKPLVNYLPRPWRDRLAPHVNVYTRRSLMRLFDGLPVKVIKRTILFGAYDNIIDRRPAFGKLLRTVLQFLEKTPLRAFGLSHFWVVEKTAE
ncbi:MAG: class I SAM-dependent methyltransferase [Anaerolineaceae bacterium]|jgi:SAM-dependent methyltransferase|nr:class I SAM-dependent methyltransferase [Anaerolineaceae bacterium]